MFAFERETALYDTSIPYTGVRLSHYFLSTSVLLNIIQFHNPRIPFNFFFFLLFQCLQSSCPRLQVIISNRRIYYQLSTFPLTQSRLPVKHRRLDSSSARQRRVNLISQIKPFQRFSKIPKKELTACNHRGTTLFSIFTRAKQCTP